MQAIAYAVLAFFKLLGRGLDKLDEYDAKRKQIQRDERRASVQDNPHEAFTDLFGKSDNGKLHQPINRNATNDPLRTKQSADTVDNDGRRSSDDT